MSQDYHFKKSEKLFKLLASKRRLAILEVLKKHTHASVGYLSEKVGLSLAATSKHLQLLESGGLVTSKEDGLFRLYSLKKQKDKIARYILSQ